MKRTNVVIDEALIKQGIKLTGQNTIRDLVDYALRELIRRKDQRSLLKLKGKVNWKGNLDAMRELR